MQSLLGLPFSLKIVFSIVRFPLVLYLSWQSHKPDPTNPSTDCFQTFYKINHPGTVQDCLYPWSTMHKQLVRVSSVTLPDSHGYSLIPRPPPFFVVRFVFSIIHGSRRAWKTEKAWSHPSYEWTQGGHREEGPNHKNNALVHPFKRSTAVPDLRH